MKKLLISAFLVVIGCITLFSKTLPSETSQSLLRSTPQKEHVSQEGIQQFYDAVAKNGMDMHSVMILRHGHVIAEKWWGDNSPDKNHTMYSVSKSFTASAVGFAVSEKLLSLDDQVISFFPDRLPTQVSPYLKELKIKDLLTMSVGHEKDPTGDIRNPEDHMDWERLFLAVPIVNKPGTQFLYNSMATYMLSAIVQKVSGQKLIDYLEPRLFRPLGITNIVWAESPSHANTGGWGLEIKTEDMAKFGQLFIEKGIWKGKQVLPKGWVEQASSYKIDSRPAGGDPNAPKNPESDWYQGYCYQMWRCRHNTYRADGANGQFIIIIPEEDMVVAITANINDMQAELNLVWQYILPAIRK